MADITPDEQGLFVIPNVDDDDSLPMVSAGELSERSAQLAGDTTDLSAAKQITVPEYILPDKVYHVLKWLAAVVCPALATLVSHVGKAVGYAQADTAAIIIVEVGLFFGACIGVSAVTAKPKE